MKQLLLILIILTNAQNARLDLIAISEDVTITSATKCLLKISNEHFAIGEIVNIVLTKYESKSKIVESYFNESKWSIFIRKQSDKSYSFPSESKSHNYIIYITSIEEILSILPFLKQFYTWNPSGKFVVTSTTVFENTTEAAVKIAKIIWSCRILNLVIMLPKTIENDSLLLLFSWFPYANGKCADDFNEIKIIDTCEAGVFHNSIDLFRTKIPNNLNGCMVKVRPVNLPPFVMVPSQTDRTKSNLNLTDGLEVSMLNTVAKAANFTVNYTLSRLELDWGLLVKVNSTLFATGMMKLLLDKEIDIGLGCIGGTSIRYEHLAQTISYIQDYLVWCVPHAFVQPKWKCLFIIFQTQTWALTLLTLVLASLCLWGLSYMTQNEIRSYKIFQRCTSNTFSVLLGVSVEQPRGGLNRIFFIIWVIFSLHWTTSYQTALISVLTQPSYEKQIADVDDIFDNQLPYGFVQSAIRYFDDKTDWRMRKMHSEYVPCNDSFICLKNIAYERNYALAFSKIFLLYNKPKFMNSDGKSMLFLFKTNIVSFPVQMLLSREFPFKDRMNELILRVCEAGLLKIWFRKLLSQQKHDAIGFDDENLQLSVTNLQGSFTILGFGISVAIVAFICEIFVHKRNYLKNKADNSHFETVKL